MCFLKIDADQTSTDVEVEAMALAPVPTPEVLWRNPPVLGVIDWSEACQGDGLFDLATLTLAHEEHLDDVLVGYGADVDPGLIRAWRSWRCLTAIRWLFENGYGPPQEYPEVAVLRSHS